MISSSSSRGTLASCIGFGLVLWLVGVVQIIQGACPSQCNGHGTCGAWNAYVFSFLSIVCCSIKSHANFKMSTLDAPVSKGGQDLIAMVDYVHLEHHGSMSPLEMTIFDP
jgi:hypothetical protein